MVIGGSWRLLLKKYGGFVTPAQNSLKLLILFDYHVIKKKGGWAKYSTFARFSSS